jgi:TM2 domain-containing membrane protein YozV
MTASLDLPARPSEKSRGVALALAAVLGVFGAHRFYVGKTGTGLAMLCTLGGAGLWYLYDLIVVAGLLAQPRPLEDRSYPSLKP